MTCGMPPSFLPEAHEWDFRRPGPFGIQSRSDLCPRRRARSSADWGAAGRDGQQGLDQGPLVVLAGRPSAGPVSASLFPGRTAVGGSPLLSLPVAPRP
jgi:hypothetical protein